MAQISAESLDIKIRKAEEKVMRLGDQYNAACEELKELRAKKSAIEHETLIAAFLKSSRTFDEVMAFFTEGTPQEAAETVVKKRRGRPGKAE
jgi:cell fate (sporulation/competence/biofilm development) regulator YlbF (YheA/YmcA/DUF963 family)